MVGSTLHSVEKGTFMADCGIGEILLNFMMSEEAKPVYGVDVTKDKT